MASIISSSSNTSLPPSWPSESNSTATLRDVSFSSYLNSSEETYIRTLVQSSQNLRISDPQHDLRRKKADDGEIDVFGAEKYFSGGIEEESSKGAKNLSSRKYQQLQHQHQQQQQNKQHQHQQHLRDHTPNSRVKVLQQPQTPSSHSESSWNSQTALLRRVHRNPSRGSSSSNTNNSNSNSNSNKIQGKRSFLIPCYCCDKSSLDIEEKAEIMQISNKIGLHTDPNFAFPVSEAPPSSRGLIKTVQKIQLADDDDDDENEGRKSLEVFGSSELDIDGIGSKSFSLERRLSMLSWDAIPRATEEELINNPSSGGPPSESYRDDTGSDASSDLFEIECLSCTANPVVVGVGPRPPSSEGCPTPTTCYAPSEASIEWSVVTASAADFSVISDSEDQRSTLTASTARPPKQAPPTSKPRPGILLGCKSQKAVRVAGEVHRPLQAHRKVNKSERQRMQMMSKYSENKGLAPTMSMSRFQAEAKVMGGFGAQKQRQDVIPSPRWSHSSHASEILYIQ